MTEQQCAAYLERERVLMLEQIKIRLGDDYEWMANIIRGGYPKTSNLPLVLAKEKRDECPS